MSRNQQDMTDRNERNNMKWEFMLEIYLHCRQDCLNEHKANTDIKMHKMDEAIP